MRAEWLALLLWSRLASAVPSEVHTALGDVAACLPIHSDGRTLAATGGGLVLVGSDGVTQAVWTALDGLPGTRLHAIVASGDGFFVGGEDGLALVRVVDGALRVVRRFVSKPVRAIAVHEGSTFVATWGGGVMRLLSGGLEPISGPPSLQATSLAVHGGALYVGAVSGLYRLVAGELERANVALPAKLVWSLASDGKQLWIGTVAGLVALPAARSRGVEDTRALLVSDGELLVGSYGGQNRVGTHVNGLGRAAGVTCVAAEDGLFVRRDHADWRRAELGGLPSNDVVAMATVKGELWVGTFDHGLAYRRGGAWHTVDSVERRINAMVVDRQQMLWIATARGLCKLDPATGAMHRFTAADGLPSNDVHAVTALDHGVAAGTAHGLVILEDDRLSTLNGKQGLEGDAVWAVAASSNMLWIGTSRGLFRWDVLRHKMRRYAIATGHLDEDWVTAIAVAGDDVWVGTYSRGVTHLSADSHAKKGYRAESLQGGPVNTAGLGLDAHGLWAATMNGLRRYQAGSWTDVVATPGKDVTAIATVSDGLWIASRRGIALSLR